MLLENFSAYKYSYCTSANATIDEGAADSKQGEYSLRTVSTFFTTAFINTTICQIFP